MRTHSGRDMCVAAKQVKVFRGDCEGYQLCSPCSNSALNRDGVLSAKGDDAGAKGIAVLERSDLSMP